MITSLLFYLKYKYDLSDTSILVLFVVLILFKYTILISIIYTIGEILGIS